MQANRVLRKMWKSKLFMIGAVILVFLIFICATSPLWVKWDPTTSNLRERLIHPEWLGGGLNGHPFGTDPLGRDVLTRLVIGGWISLKITFTVTVIAMAAGAVVGLISGFYGGILDMIMMRISDMLLAIPQLLLAIVVVTILGPSMFNLIFTLSVTSWVATARLVRSVVLDMKHREFVSASKVLGAPTRRIIWKEMFPNTITQLMIAASGHFGGTILVETNLSYLGMGVPVPDPSWGNLISDGRQYIAAAPWIVIAPGIALMLAVLGFNFLGDGIRDVFDPKNQD